jgi:amino acid adenylation domain-containing protein
MRNILINAIKNNTENRPDCVALQHKDQQFTYAQLHQNVVHCAHHLTQQGIQLGDRVILLLDPSVDTIVIMLACLAIGAIYIPQTTHQGDTRLHHVIDACDSKWIVVHDEHQHRVAYKQLILIDPCARLEDDTPIETHVAPEQDAYILFTSGTTGQPKGVRISHGNIQHLFLATETLFDFNTSDIIPLCHSYVFDFSLWEIGCALINGGKLIILEQAILQNPRQLWDAVCAKGMTVLNQTPSAFRALLRIFKQPANSFSHKLRYVVFGGETLPFSLIEKWYKYAENQHTQCVNMYGITECTVHSTFYSVPITSTEQDDSIIGDPLPGLDCIVMNENRQCEDGETGELWISGPTVSTHGYLRPTPQEAARFRIISHLGQPKRFYCTGDLVKRDVKNRLVYQGRKDSQVKINGHRIELADIEYALLRLPMVHEASVSLVQGRDYAHLKAYVVLDDPHSMSANNVLKGLNPLLPDYMLPQQLCFVDHLPLNIQGKHIKHETATSHSLETDLLKLMQTLLNAPDLKITDNFFQHGGHSLSAMSLLADIYEHFQVDLELSDIFTHPTATTLVQKIQGMQTIFASFNAPAATLERWPLIQFQNSIQFMKELTDCDDLFYMDFELHIEGRFSVTRLRDSFRACMQQFPECRLALDHSENEPHWHILDDSDALFTFLVGSHPFENFDAPSQPLWRAVITEHVGSYQCRLVFHHIIMDGYRLQQFFHSLGHNYKAPQAPKIIAPIHFPIEIGPKDEDIIFWRQELSQAPHSISLPYVFHRTDTCDNEAASEPLTLSLNDCQMFISKAKELSTTPFNLMLLLFQLTLYHASQQKTFYVGTPVNLRHPVHNKNTMAPLINAIAALADIHPDTSLVASIASLQQRMARYQIHKHTTINSLIETGSKTQNKYSHPIFQTYFTFNEAFGDAVELEGCKIIVTQKPMKHTIFDFSLKVQISKNNPWICEFEYATACFSKVIVDEIITSFQHIFKKLLTASPTVILSSLFPAEEHVLHALLNHVAQHNDTHAVVSNSVIMTYAQLHQQSDYYAHHLQNMGISPGSFVAVSITRSTYYLVSLIAIMKCGAIFLPIDSSLPIIRLKQLTDTVKLSLIIYMGLETRLESLGVPLLNISKIQYYDAAKKPFTPCFYPLAYCFATSGTTGLPKAILISHRSFFKCLQACFSALKLSQQSKFYAITPFCFDISLLECIAPLIHGGCCVLTEADVKNQISEILQFLQEYPADVLQLTPSLANLLMAHGWQGDPQLNLLCGGEPLPDSLASQLIHRCKRLWHMYGPTEATIWCCYQHYINSPVTLGNPLPGYTMAVLDKTNQPITSQNTGELLLRGVGLAVGYYNDPELTASKFPTLTINGTTATYYKTGDIVLEHNGEWHYQRRLDRQIKCRGHRIECEDIEACLQAYPSIMQARLIQYEEEIYSFVICQESSVIDQKALKQYMQKHLPKNMQPKANLILQHFPMTANGKVNDEQLIIYFKSNLPNSSKSIQQTLQHIWQRYLSHNEITPQGNFFSLGGHSLSAMRMIHEVNREFDCRLSLPLFLKHSTLEHLEEMLLNTKPSCNTSPDIHMDYPNPIALSSIQKHMWFHQMLHKQPQMYQYPVTFLIDGPLDKNHLQNSLQDTIAQFPILSSHITVDKGIPRQHYHDNDNFILVQARLPENLPTDQVLQHYIQTHAIQCQTGPMQHCALFSIAEHKHLLLLLFHHIVCDAWSVDVFLRYLSQMYEGKATQERFIDVREFILWEQNHKHTQRYTEQIIYWQNEISGHSGRLPLPYLETSLQATNNHAKHLVYEWHEHPYTGCRQQAAQFNCSPMVWVLAITLYTLHRHLQQDTLMIAVPSAFRYQTEYANTFGPMMNILPIKSTLKPRQSLKAFVHQIQQTMSRGMAYQPMDLSDIPSSPVHFDALLVYQPKPTESLILKDCSATELRLSSTIAKYPITFWFYEDNDSLTLNLEYQDSLLPAWFMQSLVADIAYLNLAIKKPLVNDPPHHWLKVVLQQCADRPDAIAIKQNGRTLHYRDLYEHIITLRQGLVDHGIQSKQVVAVYLPRSYHVLAAACAIMSLGAIYCPLDVTFPDIRIKSIVEDASPVLCLGLGSRSKGVNCPWLNILSLAKIKQLPETISLSLLPFDPAYLMYTSGTTGRPKGVLNHHVGLSNRLMWMLQHYSASSEDVVLHKTSLGFDVSLWEMFIPLLTGGTCIIANEQDQYQPQILVNLIQTHQVTLCHFVPSMLRMMLSQNTIAHLDSLRHVFLSGEALSPTLANKALNSLPKETRLHNLYGPTEASIDVTACEITKNATNITLGHPIQHTRIFIVDEYHKPLPTDTLGQIAIAGVGLALGYYEQPALTQQAFITLPHSNERVYLTGDRGKWNKQGKLEFHGRMDRQIKRFGQRIELADIEANLMGCSEIEDVVVEPINQGEDTHLIAFLILTKPQPEQDAVSLIKYQLSKRVPTSMQPEDYRVYTAFPCDHNGKIDRLQLKQDYQMPRSHSRHYHQATADENDIKFKIEAIWRNILGRVDTKPLTAFFDEGGTSMALVQLQYYIEDGFGVSLDLMSLLKHATISQQVTLIRDSLINHTGQHHD